MKFKKTIRNLNFDKYKGLSILNTENNIYINSVMKEQQNIYNELK